MFAVEPSSVPGGCNQETRAQVRRLKTAGVEQPTTARCFSANSANSMRLMPLGATGEGSFSVLLIQDRHSCGASLPSRALADCFLREVVLREQVDIWSFLTSLVDSSSTVIAVIAHLHQHARTNGPDQHVQSATCDFCCSGNAINGLWTRYHRLDCWAAEL